MAKKKSRESAGLLLRHAFRLTQKSGRFEQAKSTRISWPTEKLAVEASRVVVERASAACCCLKWPSTI